MDHDAPQNDAPSRILVVEDDLFISLDVQAMLLAAGFEVFGIVRTVKEALRLLEAAQPDAAVLDFNLMGQAVTPVAERLHELDVPFLLVSAYDVADLGKITALAEVPKLGKPISEAKLLATLAVLLCNRSDL